MEIDAQNLPGEAGLLRQIVLQLLGVVDEKDGCWSACNTSCSNCYGSVTGRSGSASTKTSSSCLRLRSSPPPRRKRPSLEPREAELPGPRNEPTSKVMDANRCRHLWSVVAWCSTWRKRNGNVGTARNRCSASERTLANDWSSFPPPSM